MKINIYEKENLILHKFGYYESSSDIFYDEKILDLIIVPSIAFDHEKNRIGFGRGKRRTSESMWFHRSDGRFAYVTYIGVFDDQDQYMGVLEYVHDIAPLLDLGPDKRGLAPLEGDGEQEKDLKA